MIARTIFRTVFGIRDLDASMTIEAGQLVYVLGPYDRVKTLSNTGSVLVEWKGHEGWLWEDEIRLISGLEALAEQAE